MILRPLSNAYPTDRPLGPSTDPSEPHQVLVVIFAERPYLPNEQEPS